MRLLLPPLLLLLQCVFLLADARAKGEQQSQRYFTTPYDPGPGSQRSRLLAQHSSRPALQLQRASGTQGSFGEGYCFEGSTLHTRFPSLW